MRPGCFGVESLHQGSGFSGIIVQPRLCSKDHQELVGLRQEGVLTAHSQLILLLQRCSGSALNRVWLLAL